jgi:putative mRNA 3-end processing factor
MTSQLLLPLVSFTEKGLFCKKGDFYIDPMRAVGTALITHAHSDHARRGHGQYYCAQSGVGVLKARLGSRISVQGIPFGKSFRMGEVDVSLHSAGHILGSAQVRIQFGEEVWVVSGDYKRDPDPSCEPFEVVPCDTFITEATFGTPRYRWEKNKKHGLDILQWWKKNAREGKNSLLFGYSLGKAQRILAELLNYADQPILVHESIIELSQCYLKEGRKLAPFRELSPSSGGNSHCSGQLELGTAFKTSLEGELILAPPFILRTDFVDRLGQYETAFASGWMQDFEASKNYRTGLQYDHGFLISDHADWDDLNQTIHETGAREVYVMHRSTGALVRHLRMQGLVAHPVSSLEPEKYAKLKRKNLELFQT